MRSVEMEIIRTRIQSMNPSDYIPSIIPFMGDRAGSLEVNYGLLDILIRIAPNALFRYANNKCSNSVAEFNRLYSTPIPFIGKRAGSLQEYYGVIRCNLVSNLYYTRGIHVDVPGGCKQILPKLQISGPLYESLRNVAWRA